MEPASLSPETRDAQASTGRPLARLPLAQLIQLSAYWFGINAIWGGWEIIGQERMPRLVDPAEAGRLMGLMEATAVVVAILVQPTVGTISDYTVTRWGRRKPFIAIGSVLNLLFLVGIATSQTYLSVFAFLVLLQFSSNLAQGPFQGYVPDLVPERQVGLASALMGVMIVLGLMGGQVIAATGYLLGGDFTFPTIALGLVGLVAMLATVLFVREGRGAKPRGGRSWRSVALEAWGTDIVRERSYVWLVASRLFALMGASTLYNLVVFYMTRSLGFGDAEKAFWLPVTSGLIALAVLASAVPAAMLSDRVGRKPIIYASCATGAAGMAILVVTTEIGLVLAGVVLVAVGSGAFLAVDWALMTQIIPQASAGRYMGMSNVATASNGALAVAIGGTVMDLVGGPTLDGSGPRAALVVAIAFYAVGAVLLRPVQEPPRAERPARLHRGSNHPLG
jgi:MFS family permease